MFGGQKLDFRRLRELRACENNGVFKYIRVAPFDLCIQHSIVQNSSCRLWRVAEVRGLNWHFESSSRYSGLSRCVPSSSHRLPRSFRREYGPIRLVADEFVSSTPPTSSPGPSPRRFSKWRIVGRRPWPMLN